MLGLLHLKFRPVWADALKVLASLARRHFKLVWPVILQSGLQEAEVALEMRQWRNRNNSREGEEEDEEEETGRKAGKGGRGGKSAGKKGKANKKGTVKGKHAAVTGLETATATVESSAAAPTETVATAADSDETVVLASAAAAEVAAPESEVERRFSAVVVPNLDDGGDVIATDTMTFISQLW